MNLQKLRLEKNCTQHKMAQFLHCSDNKYASWEQGRTQPSIEDLKILADFFQVSVDYLIGHSEIDGIVYSKSAAPALTPDEQELINGFRQLNTAARGRLLGNLEGLLMARNLTIVPGNYKL